MFVTSTCTKLGICAQLVLESKIPPGLAQAEIYSKYKNLWFSSTKPLALSDKTIKYKVATSTLLQTDIDRKCLHIFCKSGTYCSF